MNRPEARNALSASMLAGMTQAWNQVDSDPDIRVCILTGAGGFFCAGADLKAMTTAHPSDTTRGRDLSVIESLLKGRRLTKPLIAAVEGPAIAGGTEILQAHRHPGGRRERPLRGLRAAVGAVPARRLGGAPGPPDPLHRGCGPAADRTAHQGGRGHGDRPDRARRPGWRGAGQGTGDGRDDRGERPARGAGDPAHHPRDRGDARERRVQDRRRTRAWPCSPARMPRRVRARSPRSARPTSRAAERTGTVRRVACAQMALSRPAQLASRSLRL